MKLFYSFLLSFFLFVTITLPAQVTPPLPEFIEFPSREKLSVDPLRILWGGGFITSEYSVIYNRNLGTKLELYGKLGYMGHHFWFRNAPLEDGSGTFQDLIGINGYTAGIGIQYFFGKQEQKRWFLALENNYSFTRYINKNQRAEYFDLSKFASTMNIGHRMYIRPINVEIDVFVGYGILLRNYYWSKNENYAVNDDGEISNAAWSLNLGLELEPSVRWTVPVGLRLGYRF